MLLSITGNCYVRVWNGILYRMIWETFIQQLLFYCVPVEYCGLPAQVPMESLSTNGNNQSWSTENTGGCTSYLLGTGVSGWCMPAL